MIYDVILVIGATCILLFGGVVAFGAPFLPVLNSRVDDALDLLNLKKGQRILELGSGDGRIMIAAAKRGIYSTGYELNPLLVLWSYLLTARHRKYVTIKWGNYWKADWPEADGVFVFLLKPYMEKLDKRMKTEIKESGKSMSLVSFAFTIESKKVTKEDNGMFLYKYKS
ncbi:MAG: hypothetical protein ACI9T8_000538 [Candidatus Saccharimonadales bacterium]